MTANQRPATTAKRTSPQSPARLLVVDDHAQARQSMADILRCIGYEVDCCSGAVEALATLKQQKFDVIISDLNMPGMTGLQFIKELQTQKSESQVIMATAYATVGSAVEAMRYGAFDYIEKPLRVEQLEEVVSRALTQADSLDERTLVPPEHPHDMGLMVGGSRPMQELRRKIAQVGPTDATVLITGENGTGKELVAKTIHAASRRSAREMISLNCPVLSASLMESELFGHERGAFTSADAPRVGRFELADGGTILLDEITEIDLPLQAKLLRVLQEKSFERVGASTTQRVDVRVLATTNRNLRQQVTAGAFREDLYFRLAVVELHVPPLRERREDIPLLIEHFAKQAAERLASDAPLFHADACELLTAYHWPGNVRELENIITRATVFAGGLIIGAEEIRHWLIAADGAEIESPQTKSERQVGVSLEDMERKLIEATLERFDGHRQKTADALGIGVRTLSGKLRAYGLAPRAKTFSKAG